MKSDRENTRKRFISIDTKKGRSAAGLRQVDRDYQSAFLIPKQHAEMQHSVSYESLTSD